MPVGPYIANLLQIKPHYTPDPNTENHPINVLWFKSRSAGTPTLANLIAIANIFDPSWAGVFQAIGGDEQYLGSQVTDFSSNTGLTYGSMGTFVPVTGGHGAGSPPNVAALISLYTGERYRGGHPRIYLPYVGVDVLSGATYHDQISAAAETALSTAFQNMMTALAGSGVLGGQDLVVLRGRRTATPTLHALVDFTAQRLLASQRRRLRKAPHH